MKDAQRINNCFRNKNVKKRKEGKKEEGGWEVEKNMDFFSINQKTKY